jgi:hypothetical protein
MKKMGPLLSVEDPDTFLVRGFPDLASREPIKAMLREGERGSENWRAS